MAKTSTTKTSANLVETLEETLVALITPAINAVHETAVQGTKTPTDIGGKLPVHNQLRWTLNQVCQNIHDTLYAIDRVFPDGRPNYCLKDRRDYSQASFMKLNSQHSDDPEKIVSDPAYHRIASWMQANYASYDLYRQLEEVFGRVYEHVAGEAFKPYVRPKDTVVKAAMDEAKRKAALAKVAELKKLAS